MKCVVCHGESMGAREVKEPIEVGSDVLNVTVTVPVCQTCGERYYDRKTVMYLEKVEAEVRAGGANWFLSTTYTALASSFCTSVRAMAGSVEHLPESAGGDSGDGECLGDIEDVTVSCDDDLGQMPLVVNAPTSPLVSRATLETRLGRRPHR